METQKMLTLSEVQEILLKKDIRTIREYVAKGVIPSVAYKADDCTIDPSVLAKELGVADFSEPFIDEHAMRTALGLPDGTHVATFCIKNGVNVYRLGNERGMSYLFRQSDADAFNACTLEFYPHGFNEAARKHQEMAVLGLLSVVLTSLGVTGGKQAQREIEVFEDYLHGKTFADIARSLNMSTETIRTLFSRLQVRLAKKLQLVQEWIKVFGPTRYGKMAPDELLVHIELLTEQNNAMRTQLALIAGGKTYEESLSPAEIAMNKLLDIPIEDLELSVGTYNTVKRLKLFTLRHFTSIDVLTFLKMDGVGKLKVAEMEAVLEEKGLSFSR